MAILAVSKECWTYRHSGVLGNGLNANLARSPFSCIHIKCLTLRYPFLPKPFFHTPFGAHSNLFTFSTSHLPLCRVSQVNAESNRSPKALQAVLNTAK